MSAFIWISPTDAVRQSTTHSAQAAARTPDRVPAWELAERLTLSENADIRKRAREWLRYGSACCVMDGPSAERA